MENIGTTTGKSIPQIAINWLAQKNTVSNIVIGARNEEQLLDNLNSIEWELSEQHMNDLNTVSKQDPIYPHWVGER